MTNNGKVKINTTNENEKTITNYLLNINNAKDIILFSIPDTPNIQLVYISLNNGDVYYYKVGDTINNKYTATKSNNVSNIKKIFIKRTTKENAGGNWELIAETIDNKYISLNKESI